MKLKEGAIGELILKQAVKERMRRMAQNPDLALIQAAKREDKRRKTAIAAFTSGGAALGGTAGAVSGTPAGVLAGTAAGAAVGNYVGRKLYREGLDKPTPSPAKIAKKHRVPLSKIKQQLKIGAKVEKEHTSDTKTAKEIARDHLGEKPDYYTRLKKVEEGAITESLKYYKDTDVEEDDVEYPTWRYDEKGKAKVVVPRGHIEAVKRQFKNNPHGYNKYWHHPFTGLIPHERDEAELTKKLMVHPNIYKDRIKQAMGKDKELSDIKYPRVKQMFGKSARELDDHMAKTHTTERGGIAHEILTKRDNRQKVYNKLALGNDDAIDKIRSGLAKRYYQKAPVKAAALWQKEQLSEKNWDKWWLKKALKKATKNSLAHKSANKAKDK
jgi:Protein of unknown function (DUF5661)